MRERLIAWGIVLVEIAGVSLVLWGIVRLFGLDVRVLDALPLALVAGAMYDVVRLRRGRR